MRIYVTGGTGFIGSYVVKQLSNEGHEVVVLARKPEKVPALSMLPGVKIVCAPMEDLKAVEKAIVKPDAAISIDDREPDRIISINTMPDSSMPAAYKCLTLMRPIRLPFR